MAPPKTLLDKIIHAIRAQPPAHSDGPSASAIKKYLQSELDVDTKSKATAIKNAFKKGVEKKQLIQVGQRYRVAGDKQLDIPKDPEVGVEDVKDGTGSVCEVGDTVVMKYEGKLDDGSVFDKSSSFEFTLGGGEGEFVCLFVCLFLLEICFVLAQWFEYLR